jgi:hypothetical protein
VAKRAATGIFYLETDWWGVKDPTTVEPVLHLLRSVAYYVRKWTCEGLSRYPVLYLGFHGRPGLLLVGEGRGRQREMTLDRLAELLDGKCKGKVIHFGSCSTLDVHGHTLKSFLRKTGALALFGYRGTTDWLDSAAFEVLLLGEIQQRSLTKHGMRALKRDPACGLLISVACWARVPPGTNARSGPADAPLRGSLYRSRLAKDGNVCLVRTPSPCRPPAIAQRLPRRPRTRRRRASLYQLRRLTMWPTARRPATYQTIWVLASTSCRNAPRLTPSRSWNSWRIHNHSASTRRRCAAQGSRGSPADSVLSSHPGNRAESFTPGEPG